MFNDNTEKTTKQRVLESAAILFSEKGFANTSVVDICEHACANIASVNYYYKSKASLYRLVLRYTYEQAESLYPLSLEGENTAEEKLYHMVLAMLRRMLNREMTGNYCRLVSLEMAEPTEESGSFITEVIFRQRGRVHRLISEIYGKPADESLLSALTHSVMSQCLFVGMHEKGRIRHLKRKPFELEDAEFLARHITNFSVAAIQNYRDWEEAMEDEDSRLHALDSV